jgi:hypothetical protein
MRIVCVPLFAALSFCFSYMTYSFGVVFDNDIVVWESHYTLAYSLSEIDEVGKKSPRHRW